jgi:hypothetical protein
LRATKMTTIRKSNEMTRGIQILLLILKCMESS